MSEGPTNFGKPIGILVLLGCIGGGAYAYLHWPSVYEQKDGQSIWSVDWPHEWDTFPAQDAENPTRVNSRGPLPDDAFGVGWGMGVVHGTLIWPEMVVAKVPGTPDTVIQDVLIDNKKALTFEYEDNETRFVGCAVERGDMLIYVAIGCNKANFPKFRDKLFEKVIKSVKCSR